MKYIYCIKNGIVDNVIAVDNPDFYIKNCYNSLSRFDKIIVKDRNHEPGDPGNGWEFDHKTDEFISPKQVQVNKAAQIAAIVKDLSSVLDDADPNVIAQTIASLVITQRSKDVIMQEQKRVSATTLQIDKKFAPDKVAMQIEALKQKQK